MLQAARRRALVQPEGGDRLLARQRGRRRHPPLHRREPQRDARDLPRPAPAALEARRQARTSACPISSRRSRAESADYVGGFVVTSGIEEVRIAERFERANDDYRSILVKALADRIAEAFAERMHQRVRKEFWGYAPDENLAQRGPDPRGISAASARRPAIRRSPTTPRRRRCSACSRPSAASA